MKAIRVSKFGGPEVLQLEEIPLPLEAPHQVVVHIHAAGVNPVETYIRSGAYGSLPALPYTPGRDAAGIVVAVGSAVTAWKPGNRVYLAGTSTGAYAEFAVCETSDVHALPNLFSFAQGAAIGIPYATAYRALFQRARLASGETVLIHGASGGVGVAATQLAHSAGARVIGTAGTDGGLSLIRENGADEAVSHRSENHGQKILEWTGGRGVDVIIEMAAHVNLGLDLTLLAKGGRVVVVGSRGKIEINPRDAMSRDAAILAMTLMNATPDDLTEIHGALGREMAAGRLRPIIGREFPLAEAAAAHVAVMEPGARGKIVLRTETGPGK